MVSKARRTQRTEQAKQYRQFYSTVEWRNTRAEQLHQQPLCERCLKQGVTTAATVVNHRKAHKGDRELFFDLSNLESTCAPCHDQVIQSEETGGTPHSTLGYRGGCDASGWPTDPRHPVNRLQSGQSPPPAGRRTEY